MCQESLPASANSSPTRPLLPLLLVLFAGSGCSALIYEIVWCQLLQLVIGSSAVSLAVLLGTFMGGMCLGSIALPRLISPRLHPLRVYALLELGIAIFGLAVLFGMPLVDYLYTQAVGTGLGAILLRGAVCGVCLLPPTMLMGATLPAIARWLETTPKGVSWLGFFYGGNIAGAVAGCLLAGFYLLRVYDMVIATYVAVALNVAVALLGLGLAALTPHRPPDADPDQDEVQPAQGSWRVYVTIALSGASALAAEVIWTRLLSLMLGATVYTFSIILAGFLIGLGIGSSLGALVARTSRRPAIWLGGCQLLLTLAIAWTAYQLAYSLPYWPINPHLSRDPWHIFQLDLLRCLWAILPAACLWGASFPLALSAAAAPGQDPGRLVGATYAANTVGAICGAVVASLLLIPEMGTQDAQRVLIGLSAAAALLMWVPWFRVFCWIAASVGRPASVALKLVDALVLAAIIAGPTVFLAAKVSPVPWELVAFGRSLPTAAKDWKLLGDVGEGMNSSIAVTEMPSGVRNFHVSGKVEASSDPADMRLQRMLGHIPALFHPEPRSVLVVGFGAGVTAGSFVPYRSIQKIVICEIEPLIPQKVASYFAEQNHHVVKDKRVEINYDDARHYILTSPDKFDIITSDPIHPWVKGSATLYTREYFELCKRHLRPGGLITQWVPLYESNMQVVQSEIATFFEVFPHGTIWCNGEAYDLVLLGQAEGLKVDADAIQERLERPDHKEVRQSLQGVGFKTVRGLLKTYGGQASDFRGWLQNAAINRDRDLRLQYLAGMQLNQNQEETNRIFNQMLSYRQLPKDIFIGSGKITREMLIIFEHDIAQHLTGAEE